VPFITDLAEGLHLGDASQRYILVRSYWLNGELQLDPVTLLHEIGHAYDLVIDGTNDRPSHLAQDLADASAWCQYHRRRDWSSHRAARSRVPTRVGVVAAAAPPRAILKVSRRILST